MVSERLARLANRVARRKVRGQDTPGEWPTSREYAPASDPWDAIPPKARKVEVTTFPDGTVLTSYVGTLDEHLATPPEPKAEPEAARAPKRPARKAAKPKDENRWANYPMPGHGKT